ncbi:MAG: SMP-30/gluconolactonase/LRE family protein [Lautropia sp.]
MTPRIDRFGTITTELGECPLWHAGEACLWLMDCRRGTIWRLGPDGRETRIVDVPPPAGSFAFDADGGLVVALKASIVLVDPADGARIELARIGDCHPNLRLNDGTALADGSFVVGTMHVPREPGVPPLGGLFRLDADGRLRRLDAGFGIVNGPRVGPHDGRLYVCDSAASLIVSYAFDADGGLVDRRTFVDTSAFGSSPDGCCFDTQGGLWTALVRGGALARLAPDGTLTARIDLPVAHPSSLCFGGPAMDELYVTSIRDSGRLRADGPLDGAVLRVRGTGYRGYASPRCRLARRRGGAGSAPVGGDPRVADEGGADERGADERGAGPGGVA